jgi:hypothetical protein
MRNRFFKKSQKPKKKFIKEIQDQILKWEWIFYDYWLGEERRINTILPISWPIGYRVLESIYTKAQISPIISNLFLSRVLIGDFERNIRKVSSKWGPPSVVMNTFLDDSKWKTGIIRFDSDIERALFKSLILHFWSWRIVLVAEVYKDKQEDVLIDDFLITDNHAYSVTGFHANSDTITIINPWNSSKQKDLSLEDFFRLFSGVTFAYKL